MFKLKSSKGFSALLVIAFTFWGIQLSDQTMEDSQVKWRMLQKGLSYLEIDAPEKSILNDSKLFILKASPLLCTFQVLSSSENKKQNKPANIWAKEFGMNVIVNAGMFNMSNGRTNKGYLKNYTHFNNSRVNGKYNVMMAMNPLKESDTSMVITDMTCRNWEALRLNYHTLCQGMRMIDGGGTALTWDKRPGQFCSMVIGATDTEGNIYFLFTRSPYTHQQVIGYLIRLIPTIRTTVYLEGGPEASLYVQTGDTVISKFGSYVSKTYPNDNNDHFWKIPNVIGIRLR